MLLYRLAWKSRHQHQPSASPPSVESHLLSLGVNRIKRHSAQSQTAELNGRLPIIGVGGIDSVIAAREKIAAGATLVQIYSGFIFKGPPLIKEIVTHI